MTDLFVYTDRPIEITSIEKRWLDKYAQSWVFVTSEGEYTVKDDIKYIYQCNGCGKMSTPIKNHKKILRVDGERLCMSCCRKGERNGFYGKTHTEETVNQIKSTNREISKELWKDDEYRKKVIDGVSKPRRKGFGAEQSERVTEWYRDNLEQRKIRSKRMKKSWSDGSITPNVHSMNRSKGEKKLFSYLLENLCVDVEEKKTIHIDGKWFLPDIVVNDTIIVEYFGDYWHGNPTTYNENDIIAYKSRAYEVWERDKERIDFLEQNGYNVIVVWSSDDYKKSNLLDEIRKVINEKCIQELGG